MAGFEVDGASMSFIATTNCQLYVRRQIAPFDAPWKAMLAKIDELIASAKREGAS